MKKITKLLLILLVSGSLNAMQGNATGKIIVTEGKETYTRIVTNIETGERKKETIITRPASKQIYETDGTTNTQLFTNIIDGSEARQHLAQEYFDREQQPVARPNIFKRGLSRFKGFYKRNKEDIKIAAIAGTISLAGFAYGFAAIDRRIRYMQQNNDFRGITIPVVARIGLVAELIAMWVTYKYVAKILN